MDAKYYLGEFAKTRKLFLEYTQYSEPLSYESWMSISDDLKAAVLFVQFYDNITLAWYKVKSFYTPEENGVECILQYLIKNVPIIAADPNRFSAAYIYRVAFNCLYCICHDIKKDKERYEKECSNIVYDNDTELDLFNTILGEDDIEDDFNKSNIWKAVFSLGDEAAEVAEMLINGEKPRSKSQKEMIEKLRVVLECFV